MAAWNQWDLWVMGGSLMILLLSLAFPAFLQCTGILFTVRGETNRAIVSIFSKRSANSPDRTSKILPAPPAALQSWAAHVQAHPISRAVQETTHHQRSSHWKGRSLDHVQGLHPFTFHPPPISQTERKEANKGTNALLPHLLSLTTPAPPPALFHAPVAPQTRTSSTAHPKDLAHDSILLYASQMVCPSLAGFAANYCWWKQEAGVWKPDEAFTFTGCGARVSLNRKHPVQTSSIHSFIHLTDTCWTSTGSQALCPELGSRDGEEWWDHGPRGADTMAREKRQGATWWRGVLRGWWRKASLGPEQQRREPSGGLERRGMFTGRELHPRR